MASNETRDVDRDLAEWAQPIIADRAADCYRRLSEDPHVMRMLCLHHCRMWRGLLADQPKQALLSRRELIRLVRLAGANAAVLDEIDRAILDEVLECVFARFHRSRSAGAAHARTLMLAAGWLVEVRLAA
ncbi:MAG TPA: hypothetical protein VMU56_04960 [Beijerinckiaceae bacterium]|nr:hypothetical protein [Beijerinckiaceae bacterium]